MIDDCKPGEIFNQEICEPCPRNSFYPKKIEDSIFKCINCNGNDIFFCYGSNFRSPKRNYWRSSNYSEKFLRCPSSKCSGDAYFTKNLSNFYCDNIVIPGENSNQKVFSFYENFTAIGYCFDGFKGVLCTECASGFGSTENY